jgi:hypothetical protein
LFSERIYSNLNARFMKECTHNCIWNISEDVSSLSPVSHVLRSVILRKLLDSISNIQWENKSLYLDEHTGLWRTFENILDRK